jgi:molecular chaperone GrpE
VDEIAKEQLTARFRAYLDAADGAPASEHPDGGADGDDREPAPDLFTLLAELAALKNEVKLESRQVKVALDEFRGLFDALRDANARAADEQERRRRHEQDSAQKAQKNLLLELLELRDRLQAGQEQALRFRPGWLGMRRSVPFVASMAEGMAMNLRRLDETLARRGVRPLPVLNRPFDPRSMHAAELVTDPARAAGLVVAELRKGFLLHDQLLRPAEVAVNRPDRAQTAE